MHILRLLSVAAVAVTSMVPAFALTNADVIKMKKAELSDETILLAIGKEPADYDTSADGLIALKEAGLSEAIIQRIMKAKSGVVSPAAAATPATAAAPSAQASASSGGSAAMPSPGTTDLFAQEFSSIAPPLINPVAGKDYFLRYTIHVEDGEYNATNYARGAIIPINTPVRLESISGKDVRLRRTDTGENIKVENVDKHTKKSTSELARLLLSEEKTPLDDLPSDLASFIRAGDLRRGMTKEHVLMARGYPPAHETPSLDLDRWVFWSSRFVKQTIVFTNGRLTDGRGIY